MTPCKEEVVVVPVVHAIEVGERVLAQHKCPCGFAQDERITLLGEMNRHGVVRCTAAEGGGVHPFTLWRKMGFVEIDPHRGREFNLTKRHVLQEITHHRHTTVMAAITVGSG